MSELMRRSLSISALFISFLAIAPAAQAAEDVDALMLGESNNLVLDELRDISDFDGTRVAEADGVRPRDYDVLIVDADRLEPEELDDVGMIQRFVDSGGFVMVLDAKPTDHASIADVISFDLSAGAGGERSEMVMFGAADAGDQDEMLIVDSGDLRPEGAAAAPKSEVAELRELAARRAAITARDQIEADRTGVPVTADAAVTRAGTQLPEATTSCSGDKQLCDISAQYTSFHVDNTPKFSAQLPNGYWWPPDFEKWNRRWPSPKTQEASWQSDEYFDVYLDNDSRPQGDNQVIIYRHYSTFNPARTDTFFHMDDVFNRPPFGSDAYFERAWWTGTVGVNAEPVATSERIGPAPQGHRVGSNPEGVATGDFNGDGRGDVATANRFGDTASVLLGREDGAFAPRVDLKVGTGPTGIAVADFDNDGKADLATANWKSGDVSVLLGTGKGPFQKQRSYPTGGVWLSGLDVGDVNRDGKVDVVVATQKNVAVLLNKGNGTFGEAKRFGIGGGNGSGIALGDLNGDTKPDLAVTFTNSGVTAMVGDGTGSFTTSAQLRTSSGIGADARAVAIGDLNGDSKGDLAVASLEDRDGIAVAMGKGDGTFLPPAKVRVSTTATPGSRGIVIADANADGRNDIAVANMNAGTTSLLTGAGAGAFSQPLEFAVGGNPVGIDAADISGGKAIDLAVTDRSPGEVMVIRGAGQHQRPAGVDALHLGKFEPTAPNGRTTYSTGTDTTVGIQLSSPDAGAGLGVNRTVTQSESTTIPSWSWDSQTDPVVRSFKWLFGARTPCDARPTANHSGCFEFSDGDGVSVKRPSQTSLDAIRTSAYGRWDARVPAPGQQPAFKPMSSADGQFRFRLSSPVTLIDSHCTLDGQFMCEPPAGWTQYALNTAPNVYGIDPSVVNPCPDSELLSCQPVRKPELFRCEKWEKKAGRSADCVKLGAEIKRGEAANGYEEEKIVGRVTLAKPATDPNGVDVIVTSDRRNAQLQRGSNDGNLTRGTVSIGRGEKVGDFVILTNDDEPIRCTGERSVTASIRAFYVEPADAAQLRVERPAGTCD